MIQVLATFFLFEVLILIIQEEHVFESGQGTLKVVFDTCGPDN